MNTYYLPDLLSIEDYKVMSVRFHRIINAMPEFAEKKARGDRRHMVRYRKDGLTVIFRHKNDLRNRYEIQIDCKGGRDTFYVYDYNTPNHFILAFCKTKVDAIDESLLKGEVLDFIDDYCTLNEVDLEK
jgi:hypothetical protein